jgi:hypothetical protein
MILFITTAVKTSKPTESDKVQVTSNSAAILEIIISAVVHLARFYKISNVWVYFDIIYHDKSKLISPTERTTEGKAGG